MRPAAREHACAWDTYGTWRGCQEAGSVSAGQRACTFGPFNSYPTKVCRAAALAGIPLGALEPPMPRRLGLVAVRTRGP